MKFLIGKKENPVNIRKLCIVHCEPKVHRQRMWAAVSVNKDVAAIKPSATEVTLACVSWENSGWRKQDTGPRQLRCISKEWFQWDQSLVSSHSKKSTKFINLRYLFFPLINRNLLIIYLPDLCCKNSYTVSPIHMNKLALGTQLTQSAI